MTPWTVVRQAPLSVEFPSQEYWSGLPFPPSGDLPNPGIKPASPVSPESAGGFFTTNATWEAQPSSEPSAILSFWLVESLGSTLMALDGSGWCLLKAGVVSAVS